MRTESEIKKRINELIEKIKSIKINAHPENHLIFGDETRLQLECLNEISHLSWVLNEPVPRVVFELI